MRAVVQRVSRAQVSAGGNVSGKIGKGLAVLLGVGVDDTLTDAEQIAEKLANLRIFADEAGMMNRSVLECGGEILLISQFTLFGDARRGRRPSFIDAAREDRALPLYERTGRQLESRGLRVAYGVFGAHMDVELINDGPVTILIDSRKTF